jgi:hypothetical protein
MKQKISVVFSCVVFIVIGLLLSTSDSCKKEATGTCWVQCTCTQLNCTGAGVGPYTGTKQECVTDYENMKASYFKQGCSCDCSYDYTPN